MEIDLVPGNYTYQLDLLKLYKRVVQIPDGLIRSEQEIDEDFIVDMLRKCTEHGFILLALHDQELVGAIHAHTPQLFAFQHLFTDLSILVDPDYQGMGIGRKLFTRFLQIIEQEWSHIKRVELYTREHNQRNIQFYESLGFINEGRQLDKIYAGNGKFETPIVMAWMNSFYKPS